MPYFTCTYYNQTGLSSVIARLLVSHRQKGANTADYIIVWRGEIMKNYLQMSHHAGRLITYQFWKKGIPGKRKNCQDSWQLAVKLHNSEL